MRREGSKRPTSCTVILFKSNIFRNRWTLRPARLTALRLISQSGSDLKRSASHPRPTLATAKPALRTLPLGAKPGSALGQLASHPPQSVKLVDFRGRGDGEIRCHAAQRGAPKRKARGTKGSRLPRGSQPLLAAASGARRFGPPSRHPELRARRPALDPVTGRGVASGCGSGDDPSGDRRGRDSGQSVPRGWFRRARPPQTRAMWGQGRGSPLAPENPFSVLAIKSTSDGIRRARGGEEPTCR